MIAKSHKLHPLESYILSALRIVFWFIIVLMIADSIGIPINSIVALLGVVGIALSLALQNTLSNFAGGLQVLASQPFQVGDYVDTDQGSGTVSEIGLVYCKLSTIDNKAVLIPNALIASTKIINHTASAVRRVDLIFPVSYQVPTEKVREVILSLVATKPQIHKDPEPVVYLSEFGDHAILYSLRVWANTEDYWFLHFSLKEEVREAFVREQIEIPYPQMTIHQRISPKDETIHGESR